MQNPIVAAATGKAIYVGQVFTLDGTARIWVKNEFFGTRTFENKRIHAVLVVLEGAVLFTLDPIPLQNVTITQESGDGFFDSATGRLNLHSVLNASGQISGTADITLSTENTITPPGNPSVSGQRRDSSGRITLVGDASIVGPPGKTHGWIEIDGTLSPV